MRTINIKTLIAIFSFVLLLTSGSFLIAQETDVDPIMNQLSLKQQEMLQTQRQIMLKNREQLRTSLTAEQLAILQDKTQTREQMREGLRESFSNEQNQLVQNQEGQLRQVREQFRRSLTKEQRQMLRERVQQTRQSRDQGEMGNGNGFGGAGGSSDDYFDPSRTAKVLLQGSWMNTRTLRDTPIARFGVVLAVRGALT